jgi:integrase
MPRRRIERSRVLGPVWIPSRKKWRIVVIKDGDGHRKRASRYFDDEQLANETKEKIEAGLARLSKVTVEEAIDQYRKYLGEKGTGDTSSKETCRRLKLFFPTLALPVSRVTPERAKSYYEAFRARTKENGEPISVAYHRAALINARSFASFCVEHGWLGSNPFADVKGIGRRNAGKLQHTGNETRVLYAHCMARAQAGDKAALGVLMALLMALRSSDITRRLVRDVDLDATVLRISKGKTEKSNRARKVPAVLQPLLAKLVEGRSPFEPLFKTAYTESGHHTRRWLEQAMEKFCEAAGVPYVCPHALKGTAGSILAEVGESADVIANHLSHAERSTTKRHYIAPDAVEAGQTERAFAVIAGGVR